MTLNDLTKQYQAALRQFKASNGTLAADILTLAKTVADAKASLPARDWLLFLRHNELGSKDDVSRRKALLSIGKAEPSLRKYAESLPASIWTLRHLARLGETQIAGYVQDGTINPLMRLLDAANLTVDTRNAKKTYTPKLLKRPADYSISVSFIPTTFDVKNAKSVMKTLRAFIDKHGAALGLADDLRLSLDLELELSAEERNAA